MPFPEIENEIKELIDSVQPKQLRTLIKRMLISVYLIRVKESQELIQGVEKMLETLSESQIDDIDYLQGILLVCKGSNLIWQSKLDSAIRYLENGLEIFNQSGIHDQMIGICLFSLSLAYQNIGEYPRAIEQYQLSLKFNKEKGFNYGFILSLSSLGNLYCMLGNLNLAEEHTKRAVLLARNQDNEYLTGTALALLGRTYFSMGKLDVAEEAIKEALELLEAYESNYWKAWLFWVLGSILKSKGELDQAYQYLTSSLNIFEEINFVQLIYFLTNLLGELFREKGDLHKSLEFFHKSLKYHEKMGHPPYIVRTLFNLIDLYLHLGKMEEARSYFENLKQLHTQSETEISTVLIRMVEALILKKSHRVYDIGQAQKILLDLAAEEKIEQTIKIYALLNMCDLHLYELKASGDETIIQDINSILIQLSELAMNQNLNPLMVKILLVRAKVTLIDGDMKKSYHTLNDAVKLAKKYKLTNLENQIKKEQELFDSQFEQWQEIINRNAPIAEKIEMVRMNDYIQMAKQMVSFE